MNTSKSSNCDAAIRKCWRVVSKNEAAVRNSSSGGVFYELAAHVLAGKGVVFGSAFATDGRVFMRMVENEDELKLLLGSKYVQSQIKREIYEQLKSALETQRKVLFCATPCQCNAAINFLKGEIPENLYFVDFICHGVPSEGIWKKYLSYLSGVKKINDISFRDKRISWGDFGTRVEFKDGSEYFKKHQDDIYMKLFLANRILRPSCHRCKAKGDCRRADITLGDFWGIRDERSDLGCSVVLAHTNKGNSLFNELKEKFYFSEITYDEAVRNNSNYFQSCGIPFNRSLIWFLKILINISSPH